MHCERKVFFSSAREPQRRRLAHQAGVTTATSFLGTPFFSTKNFWRGSSAFTPGLSTTFRTGSAHALENGAIVQGISALHVVVSRPRPLSGRTYPSVSQTIAGLRRLLQGWENIDTETGFWFKQAALVSSLKSSLNCTLIGASLRVSYLLS